ncbi:hypothetical protein VOLCADRAFT_116471 [Volvox carteri f. nagariensis]|uniref:Uncharacterized protein n=1 Tax=Volvox carteri f. nagariensis TaxID=3068 RepID=D8TMD0_VOLCA|nr:uncharacterized protein VOLCADRAFT_116471 [Volvox carteri f. nagariensis]EFJ51622.1 hypothetical protein VOLCADRAFT_116471 [Volvox carteri f. nagariensis]|eukprot:XP_002947574.1 hypothetical protein VOLCADRAFT_116471 [Volvox carteri f. nagariensis]
MGCSSSKDGYESQDQGAGANPDDPKKSALLREEALKIAEEMMGLTKGKRFHEYYTRLTLTSYGASCKVLTAYHRTTNKKVAVKTIPKSRKQLDRQRQKVMLEVGTFRMVEDHPNAVRMLEIFEGAECYYIVMECCGELFDHISKKQGCFTERQAAGLLRSLMLFLAHMHSKGIAHLDIKPENLMFDSEGASGVLKVLDFGSSVFVQPNEMVRNAFGTVRYASPEMANDVCGQKADIWSAGVVMYILLCGKAPFLKNNDIDTLDYIKNGPRVKFNGERWSSISQCAKDCIRTLLEPNPRARPTAVEVLGMPWLKQQVPETVIVPDTLKHLRTFANQSRIRRLLLGLMADQLVGSGANQLLGQFYSLDKDFSGTLEVSELIKAAKEAIPELSEVEINRMFEALDVDQTGTVDVKEFFAGLIQTIDEEKQTLVAQKSFTMLDKRGSGYVTKEVFMEVLLERVQAGALKMLGARAAGGGDSPLRHEAELKLHGRQSGSEGADSKVILDPGLVQELEAEFAYLDANGDGVLSFEEFKAILGIQSTPEGLTLAQPQLAAVPSLQEGMETLAQTLRTRTRSVSKDEQYQQPPMQRLALARVSHNGGGGSGTNGGAGAGGNCGPGAGPGVSGGCSGASMTAALQRHGGGGGGGRASSGGNTTQPLSVDRAQLDLELPIDLETRDLLQLLAPAKRTASQVPLVLHQQAAGGKANSGSFGDGRGGGATAAVDRAASVSRQPNKSMSAGGTGAVLVGDPRVGSFKRDAMALSVTLTPRSSRAPSSSTSVPGLSLLDKTPSIRAPSLPPLAARPGLEFDGYCGRVSTSGGPASGRMGRDSPLLRCSSSAEALQTAATAAAAAAQELYGCKPVDYQAQVRWRDPPSGSVQQGMVGSSEVRTLSPIGVAEAAARDEPSPLPSPRSCVLSRASAVPTPLGDGGVAAISASPAAAVLDDAPLLGGFVRSSDAGGASAESAVTPQARNK